MKIYFTNLRASVLLMTVATGILTSCSGNSDGNTNQPENPIPTPSDANGVLVAIQTLTTISTPLGPQTVNFGTAVAVFFNGTNSSELIDAGIVKAEDKSLTQQSGKSYTYTPSQTDISGLSFGSAADWSVSGAGPIPQFTYSFPGFPNNPDFTASTINKGQSYTVSLSNITGADSVVVSLFSGENSILKTVAETNTPISVTFSASETSSLGSGNGYVQVAPYNIGSAAISGKTFYFVNETVKTESVTIQ